MTRPLRIALCLLLAGIALHAEVARAAAPLPNVRIFSTGGTIQSRGAHRQKLMEYADGKVTLPELLVDLPELQTVATITGQEISTVGSNKIDTATLLKLARELNAWLARPEAAGAVVTHGTATLEETAYFLNLVVHSDKPVVMVGAMRPFTAVSRDGPMNLYNAVRVAAAPQSRNMGVLILLNDEINAARETTKGNTYRVDTFTARDVGPLGFADSDRIAYYRRPTYRHTAASEFDVSGLGDLPRVDVLYAYQEADAAAIDGYYAAGARGLVTSGSAAEAIELAAKRGLVVVNSDRKGSGRVARSETLAGKGQVTADNLPPHKARVLLRLALTKTTDPVEIQRMFDEY